MRLAQFELHCWDYPHLMGYENVQLDMFWLWWTSLAVSALYLFSWIPHFQAARHWHALLVLLQIELELLDMVIRAFGLNSRVFWS